MIRWEALSGNLATTLLDEALTRGEGARVALREPKRGWSYTTLAEEATRAQAAFAGLGLKRGDRIALLLHDSMELAGAMLGAMRGGCIAVPINILLRPVELREILDDCGASAIVVSADLAATVDLIRTELKTLRHVLAVGGARAGQRDYHALTRSTEKLPPPVDVSDDAPAFLLYSASARNGSRAASRTGLAARSIAAHAAYAGDGVLDLRSDDRVFSAVTLSTAYGLGLGLIVPLLSGASSFLLPARPRPRTLFDVMATFRPTIFAATPSLYAQMVQDHRVVAGAKPPFHSVRHAVSGAEGMPAALHRRIAATFSVTPLHGFGVTEALHFVLANRPGNLREASAGQPLDGVEVRLVNEGDQPVGVEEIGLLELRGHDGGDGVLRAARLRRRRRACASASAVGSAPATASWSTATVTTSIAGAATTSSR